MLQPAYLLLLYIVQKRVMLPDCGARCKHLAAIVQEYEYHALQAVRLAQHLKTLKSVVVWVDYNPTSFGVHGKPILQCLLHLNSIAHMQVSFHVFLLMCMQASAGSHMSGSCNLHCEITLYPAPRGSEALFCLP